MPTPIHISPKTWKQTGSSFLHLGQKVFFQESNTSKATPLLLLHGFPTASWDYQVFWKELADQAPLLAPDFLGFGYSAKPRNYAYSIHDQADLVTELVKSKSYPEVYLLAHDYGATVAQELLARQQDNSLPFRIHKTLLMNSGLFPHLHRPTRTQKLLRSRLGPLLSRFLGRKRFGKSFSVVFGPHTQPSAKELDAFWDLIQYEKGNMLSHRLLHYMGDRQVHEKRWVRALENAATPILFINGNADPVSGKHVADHFRQEIPQIQVIDLPHIGHYPQVEAPQEVLSALQQFFFP